MCAECGRCRCVLRHHLREQVPHQVDEIDEQLKIYNILRFQFVRHDRIAAGFRRTPLKHNQQAALIVHLLLSN